MISIIRRGIHSGDSTELSYFCSGALDFVEARGRLTLGALASAITLRDREIFPTIRASMNTTRLMKISKNIRSPGI